MKVPKSIFADKKRILIIGDAGSGKTTLSRKVQNLLHIPAASTDDALWKKKFTEHRNRDEALALMKNIYEQESWIVEGTTRFLLEPGIRRADLIIFISFKYIFSQYAALIGRYLKYRKESWINLVGLLGHVTKKRLMSRVPVLLKITKGHKNIHCFYAPASLEEK